MRRPVRSMCAVRAAVASLCILVPVALAAHPLHNSYSQVRFTPATHRLDVSVRAFADDFSRHVSGPAGGAPGGSLELRAARYLAGTLQITDPAGRVVPLTWCGWTRSGDQFVICLKGALPQNTAGLKIRNAVLMDLFTDQLNIAQIVRGDAHSNLLFRPSTSIQTIP